MEKIKDFLYFLCIFTVIALAIFFLTLAFKEQYPLWESQRQLEKLQSDVETGKEKDKIPHIDWKKLQRINPNIIGWIKVPGTKIDYPILQGKQWNEYLHKNYEGKYSYAGSIFVQPETSLEERHVVIYGHNMRTKSMFGSLHKFESEDFYRKYHKIFLYQPGKTVECTIYSVYDCLDKSSTYLTDFSDEDDQWRSWIAMTVDKNAYYPIKSKPKENSRIVTLSTCSGKEKGDSYRFVVQSLVDKIYTYEEKGEF